jgi:hypothetical protein
MKNKKSSLTILVSFVLVIWASQGSSFTISTHKAINESIAKRTISGFSLNDCLINHIGFKDGVEEKLLIDSNENKIFEWLGLGGIEEDKPEGILRYPTNTARNNRHFHNPLESWDNAGLHVPFRVFNPQSSVIWSQNQNQDVGGHWSWHDARTYFYIGLTSVSKAIRDYYFANTFRALGQLMHLVQDASVPAHVRGDVHILYMYEN